MKQTTLLNSRISAVIAEMGHTELLAITDAGFPVPRLAERIDLAVSAGIPAFFDVLNAVASEMRVERLIVAQELIDLNPAWAEAIGRRFPDAEVAVVTHDEFKLISREAKAIVRTGEFTPYSNVILQSGVVY